MSSGTISLEQAFERNRQDEIFLLGKMQNQAEMPFFIGSLKSLNQQDSVYYACIKHDYDKSKNCFYKIGMTTAYQYEKLGQDLFAVMDSFVYPLLSDNKKLIDTYLHYNNTTQKDAFSLYFARAIQAVLLDDHASLTINIEGLKKWSKKGWSKQYAGVVDVFQGFLDDNKASIENGLLNLVELHKSQEQPPIVRDYMNLEATALAKLAWYKGIEVKVDTPLILQELLPIQELSSYEGYPFFAEMG